MNRKNRGTSTAALTIIGPAIADLERLNRKDPQIIRWAAKKMLRISQNPQAGRALSGTLTGWRKITVGDRHWRIVWRVKLHRSGSMTAEIVEIWALGERSDGAVYREMRQRISKYSDQSESHCLAEVLSRLKVFIDSPNTSAALPSKASPGQDSDLPDWLITRLHNQVGLPLSEIQKLNLEQAVDTWTTWTKKGV